MRKKTEDIQNTETPEQREATLPELKIAAYDLRTEIERLNSIYVSVQARIQELTPTA